MAFEDFQSMDTAAPDQATDPFVSQEATDSAALVDFGASDSNLGLEEARNSLLSFVNPHVNMSVADAKRALLGFTNNPKKAHLIVSQIEKEQMLGSEGPSLNGIPFAYLSPENQQLAIQRQQELQVTQERNQRAWTRDNELDTTFGRAKNIAANLTASGADIVGQSLTLGARSLNFLNSLGLDPKDYETYDAVQNKLQSGQQLTRDELKFYSETIGGKDSKKTRFDVITDIKQRESYIQSIEAGVENVRGIVNDKKTRIALDKVGTKADLAIDKFSKGDYLDAIGTFMGSVADLATEDTQAAVELTANTLPQMYLLAKHALLGVSNLTATGYDQAIKDFKESHNGRMPTNEEKAIAGTLSLISVGLDVVGAKFTLGGQKFINAIKTSAAKMGLDIAPKTLAAAENAVAEAGKSVTKKALGIGVSTIKKVATSHPVKAIPVEGGTEGVQNLLAQLAGTQGEKKLDVKSALVDTAVGAVAGFGIAGTVTAAQKTAGAVVKSPAIVSRSAQVVSEALDQYLADKNIGDLGSVIQNAKDTNNPDLAIQAIAKADFTELNYKQRRGLIKELTSFVTEHENAAEKIKDPEERKAALEQNDAYRETLNTIIEVHNRVSTNGTIEQAVDTLVRGKTATTQPTKEVVKDSISTVSDSVSGTTDLNIQQVDKILGSEDFNDNATKGEKNLVKGYRDMLETSTVISDTVDNAESQGKSAAAVNKDVLDGGKGFIGIKQHMANLRRAVAEGDIEAAQGVLNGLKQFRKEQQAKLEQGFYSKKHKRFLPHTSNVAAFIEQEIAALQAAEKHTENVLKEKLDVKPKTESKKVPTPEQNQGASPGSVEASGSTKAKSEKKYVLTRDNINQVKQRLAAIPEWMQKALGKEYTDAHIALKAIRDAVDLPDNVFNKVRNDVQILTGKILKLKEQGPPKSEPKPAAKPVKKPEPEKKSDVLDLTSTEYKAVISDLKELTDKERVTYEGYVNGEEVIVVRSLDTELKQVDTTINSLLQILEECA